MTGKCLTVSETDLDFQGSLVIHSGLQGQVLRGHQGCPQIRLLQGRRECPGGFQECLHDIKIETGDRAVC